LSEATLGWEYNPEATDKAMDECGFAVLCPDWTYAYGVGKRPEGVAVRDGRHD
jgi:hypothetical protein